MTRVHVPLPLLVDQRLELPEGPARHVGQVLRMRAGELLTLFNGAGGEYQAVIEEVERRAVRVRVESYREVTRESALALTLAQCVSKGERMDYTVQKAVELGADIITVQGAEGGGHTGSVPTTLLLPQVLDAVKVPVVAAGGFYNGRGLAGALAFGAAGIAMGTRFLMTAESPVPRETLQRYLDVNDPAKIRASTAVDGMPQRMIDNPYLLSLERGGLLRRLFVALASAWSWRAQTGMTVAQMLSTALKALGEGDSAIQTMMAANAPVLIQRAMVQGRPDEGVLPSGQAASAITALPTVADLIAGIVRDAEARLGAFPAPPLLEPTTLKASA